jgi:hypothetical protein
MRNTYETAMQPPRRLSCTVTGDHYSWTVTHDLVCAADDPDDKRQSLIDGAVEYLKCKHPGSRNFRHSDWTGTADPTA